MASTRMMRLAERVADFAARSASAGQPAAPSYVEGVAASDSSGGTVAVYLGGDVERSGLDDGGAAVGMATMVDVRAGDVVSVRLVGSGAMRAPTVVGVVSGGDRTREEVRAASGEAEEAQRVADEAAEAVAEAAQGLDDVQGEVARIRDETVPTLATKTSVDALGNRVTTIEADYATSDDLSSYVETATYEQGISGLRSEVASTYLSQSDASSTYETQSHAGSTYETSSHASTTYSTKTELSQTRDAIELSASQTYETQTHASSTYETASHASSTYATKSALTVEQGRITAEVTARGQTDANVAALTTRVTQTESDVTTAISAASSAQSTASSASSAASTAQSTADAAASIASDVATLVRQYGSGVLVCRRGNSVGALVNANGSFDVVSVAWSGQVPSAGTVLARFASSTGTRHVPGAITPQVDEAMTVLSVLGSAILGLFDGWVNVEGGIGATGDIRASGDGVFAGDLYANATGISGGTRVSLEGHTHSQLNGVPAQPDDTDGSDDGSGGVWGTVPVVRSTGVMEVGKYVDFHESATDGVDYAVRLFADGGRLRVAGNGAGTSDAPYLHGWRRLGTTTGTGTLALDLSRFSELRVTARFSGKLVSAAVPVDDLSGSPVEWWIGGGSGTSGHEGSGMRALCNVSKTSFAGVQTTNATTNTTSSTTWTVYAR